MINRAYIREKAKEMANMISAPQIPFEIVASKELVDAFESVLLEVAREVIEDIASTLEDERFILPS